jgi:hypothetical protein
MLAEVGRNKQDHASIPGSFVPVRVQLSAPRREDSPSAVTENRPYAVTRNPANARLPFQAKSPALAGRCVRLGLISLAGSEVTTVGRIASDH